MTFRLPISTLFNALLPSSCLLCGTTTTDALCAGCAADLPRLTGPGCPQCGLPLAAAAAACGDCLRQRPAYDATLAALRYTYPVDRLVQALKFGHRLAGVDFFARCLLALPPPAGDVIVPVPLSTRRLRERGFNQAVEIARPIAYQLQLPLSLDSLVRVRDTLSQSSLPWPARPGNVRHAFACRSDFSGRSVIVIDDVMTSGATLDAVAQTLKDHGAARVSNLVVARAVKSQPSLT